MQRLKKMKILLILLFFLESLSSKKLAILKKNHKFSVALHKDESSIHRWLLDNDDNNPCMATVKIASNTAKYFDKSDLKFKDMLMGNQDFKMSFETGSPITWITANDCLTCQRLGLLILKIFNFAYISKNGLKYIKTKKENSIYIKELKNDKNCN